MKLSNETISMIEGVLSHNVAQKLILDQPQEAKAYLKDCVSYMLSLGIDRLIVTKIKTNVRLKSTQEAKIIKQMYAHHGIRLNAQGNGGSEVRFEIMFEQIMMMAETASTQEDTI